MMPSSRDIGGKMIEHLGRWPHDARGAAAAPRSFGRLLVQVATRKSAHSIICDRIREQQSLLVAFCNAHTVNIGHQSSEMVRSLRSAMVLNDGVGLDIASNLLYGKKFPQNLNGTDFIPRFLGETAKPLRVLLLGAKPGVSEKARAILSKRFCWHHFVGAHHGYFDIDRLDSLDALISDSRPNLIILCMGQPLQEIVGRQLADRYGVVIIAGGAFFDFVSGGVKRAPVWVRRVRMEWFFRLINEPRRLGRRYIVGNPLYIGRILKQKSLTSIQTILRACGVASATDRASPFKDAAA
jgi:alpha-1,3-mannosyltransferase